MTTEKALTAEIVKEIRAEYLEECGEDIGDVGAEIVLDQRCYAYQERVAGAGREYARSWDSQVGDYLEAIWALREAAK